MTAEQLKEKSNRIMGRIESLRIQTDNLSKNKTALEEKLDLYTKASLIVERAVKDTQDSIRSNVVRVADDVLSYVFPESYKTDIVFQSRGTSTKTSQAFFKLSKNGVEITGKNLIEGVEGGSLSVLSVALRLCFLLLKSQRRKILLLDEVFGPLSNRSSYGDESNLKRAINTLKLLSEQYGVQIILIHHFND